MVEEVVEGGLFWEVIDCVGIENWRGVGARGGCVYECSDRRESIHVLDVGCWMLDWR